MENITQIDRDYEDDLEREDSLFSVLKILDSLSNRIKEQRKLVRVK